jgi:FMN-dependent NADH-azoreductase
MNVLRIDSSASGEQSVSRKLTGALTQAIVQANPAAVVVARDLAASPIGHFGADAMRALRPKAGEARQPTEGVHREAALAEEVVTEFLDADVVVVGAPMYNFTIPTQLKAWIDRLAQGGRTFRYTENGPEGLAGGKRLVIVSSRGGKYAGEAFEAAMDHQEAYLRTIFGFFGIDDVTVLRAEGVDLGAEVRAQAVGRALGETGALAALLARVAASSRVQAAAA